MFQLLDQVSKNQGNFMDLLKQVIGNYSPEKMQNFYNVAQAMGFPNDVLNEIQNNMK